ncbi:hypothetical protein MATL_G00228420 [Megalops atlanticus]|uniref:Proline-rich coiled-coil 2A n=1 Tax=Megalops atlanticus TaxID=7932 RepID=A0A9D3SXU5_MEGAT|nr:hypothetical protein MATL_G00228420 [Megalops atlanticus]
MMPPFMYPPYLPFPPHYGPQGPYRYPPPAEAPRFSRSQGGAGPDGRGAAGPRGGDTVKRPSILKQDDLKELDELDHDGDEGWAGAHEEIDYSAKLKFSDDEGEEEAEEERSETKNCTRESREQPRSQDAVGSAPAARSRTADSGGDTRRTPPSSEDAPLPPSGKPGWAEEGAGGWVAQGRRAGMGGPREQPSPPPGPLLGQAPYSFYRQDRPSPQPGGASVSPGPPTAPQRPSASPSLLQQQGQPPAASPGPALAPPQAEDEDETWRQRRKQSSSEISAAVERARRRREEEERRMEEERRAACAEKLKRLDEKQQQLQQQQLQQGGTKPDNGSPSPALSVSASSPAASQPPSPCVDSDEPPPAPPHAGAGAGPGPASAAANRQRAGSNSSYDSNADSQQGPAPPAPQPPDAPVPVEVKEEPIRAGSSVDTGKSESLGGGAGRPSGGAPSQGYSKYQKSLPPRFQRQQQEQLLKQQQQWQQQQQHSQAAQNALAAPPQAPQGPSPGAPPQSAPKQPPLYPPGSMGRPPPLPFDPRWMMMSYMDPRMMQGRPSPMDYYPPSMHPSGLMGRERSDSGGSGSDPFDRQQPHPGPPHTHRGTPPMDPKLAWGPDVFPAVAGEGRGLGSPLRQKQPHEEEEGGKGLRSDTPPVRLREGGTGPIQQPSVAPSSPSGSSNQTPPPPHAPQGGGAHHPPHHQSFLGGRGSYSAFPESGPRTPHQQQRGGGGGLHGFSHPDDVPRGAQQGQIWGAPHPHYDRNGRSDLSPLEGNPHLHQHHPHHPHPSHFPLHPHKAENGRERGGEAKKGNPSPPLHQPSLSSSCSSSSSSSSSARDDGSGKPALHHLAPQQEHEAGTGGGGGRRPEKPGGHPSQPPLQQQHPKPGQRGREHKTETQWGPRPGSSSAGGRKPGGGAGGGVPDEPANPAAESKPSTQPGGAGVGKRAGPIKRPVLKEMKREGGEGEGGEKAAGGSGKDKEQDGHQPSAKQDPASGPQTASAPSGKDDLPQVAKPRNGGKERVPGGGSGKGPKDGDASASSQGYSAPASRRGDRERSFERGGGGGGGSYHHPAPPRGSRAGRARGEFYGRGRGYRGTYTGSGSGGGSSSRGRAGGRSSRDYRATASSSYHHGTQDSLKGEAAAAGGRHSQGVSQLNPGRARNRSETRSEGSEYEEVPKRRRQRGSETGSESAASDLAQSDKEDRKQQPKNGGGSDNPTAATTGPASSMQPRATQARVFTPRGVPSRRGRGGGSGAGVYRSGGGGGGGVSSGHRSGSGSGSHGWTAKSSSARKQQVPSQPSPPKDAGRGGSGEKKDKAADSGHTQNQSANPALSSTPTAPATTPQGSSENGNAGAQLSAANPLPNSTGTAPALPPSASAPDGRVFPPRSFERPPRRRRHGRSQHQQDKPPRFRRLKQERENARINGGGGGIPAPGGPQQRPASPSHNALQDTDGTPNATATNTGTLNANHTTAASNSSSNSGGHLAAGTPNLNSHHHHHHHAPAANPQAHPQHHHNHNPAGGAKSPDISNQNSDQANEEWETASESSDFASEFREREGGGRGGEGGRSYHHHHPSGRGGGGGGEREMTAKDSAANKRSFSSQRPGMERQNRRVNAGGGGGGGGARGPRGPPGGSGGGGPGNGGSNRGDRRGNWSSPKNRK